MKNSSPAPDLKLKRRALGPERGVILILACFSMPVIISMLGLGIDLSIMYSVKAKLQMACDGAAVAAMRSLSLAQDTASQTTMATSVATQWFNANFAGGYLGATGTTTPIVTVTDLTATRSVSVSANTQAPTYFMKYWGRPSTLIGAAGQTSRTDVAIMMVLDRSGSMDSGNYGGLTACQVMVQAAKQFTGMFQQGRDRIGLVTFAETIQVAQTPTLNFQTALGYSNTSGTSAGALDTISCKGGTNTSSGVSIGWNELYKLQLPGALNIMVVFTDGTPTAATFNLQNAIAAGSGCKDGSGVAISAGGDMAARPANWVGREANSGSSTSLGPNSFWAPISGPVGAMYGDLGSFNGVNPFFTPTGNDPLANEWTGKTAAESPGCAFVSAGAPGNPSADIAFVPDQDYWNNSSTGYRSGISTAYIQSANRIVLDSTSLGNVVFNLADNAANFARTPHLYTNGVAMPGTIVDTIGLGGTGGVDFTLLQRMANDPTGDTSVPYAPYPGYNTAQPVGQFVYAPDANQLQQAFLKLGSQILRISR